MPATHVPARERDASGSRTRSDKERATAQGTCPTQSPRLTSTPTPGPGVGLIAARCSPSHTIASGTDTQDNRDDAHAGSRATPASALTGDPSQLELRDARAPEVRHYFLGVYFDGHFVTSVFGRAMNAPFRNFPSTTTSRPVLNRSGRSPCTRPARWSWSAGRAAGTLGRTHVHRLSSVPPRFRRARRGRRGP